MVRDLKREIYSIVAVDRKFLLGRVFVLIWESIEHVNPSISIRPSRFEHLNSNISNWPLIKFANVSSGPEDFMWWFSSASMVEIFIARGRLIAWSLWDEFSIFRLTSSETRVWLSLRLQASFRFQNSPTLDYAPSIFKKFCKIENSLSIFRTLLGSRSEILALWWLSFHFQRTFLLQMSACQIRFAWCLPFRVSCQMPLRKAALLPPLCTVLLMDFLAF